MRQIKVHQGYLGRKCALNIVGIYLSECSIVICITAKILAYMAHLLFTVDS